LVSIELEIVFYLYKIKEMVMQLENIIKCNIGNKPYKEIEFKNVELLDKWEVKKGIYFIFDNKNLYIGRAKNIRSRLLQHKNGIKDKTHYNKNMLNFKINKTKCLFIESTNEVLEERYFINKFSKKLKLVNIIKPSFEDKIEFIDVPKYKLRNDLKILKKNTRRVFNKYFYNKYIKRHNESVDVMSRKINILKYFIELDKLGTIVGFENSKLCRGFYVEYKEIDGSIRVRENAKSINSISNINLKDESLKTNYEMYVPNRKR
jgi:predicted GIY-YIG superfamily endonuclease